MSRVNGGSFAHMGKVSDGRTFIRSDVQLTHFSIERVCIRFRTLVYGTVKFSKKRT